MSDPFDWQIGEEDDPLDPEPATSENSRFWLGSLLFMAATAVFAGVVIGGWRTGEKQLDATEEDFRQQVEDHLAIVETAVQAGDGDLFFSLHEPSSEWRITQLQPQNQQFYQSELTVTRAQGQDGYVWANVSADVDGKTWQRVLFFEQRAIGLRQIAAPPDYWGPTITRTTPWGTMRFAELDKAWADEIEAFVQNVVEIQCAQSCINEGERFTLTVAAHYQETAVSRQLYIPSPRLLALDETGQPADLFWEQLRKQVLNHITPTVVRFGVPQTQYPMLDYAQAAADFMTLHPDITIELIQIPSTTPEMAELAGLDGATFQPTETMLAAGFIRDLTSYLDTDPEFEQSDFYEQIWQGAWWQDRFWLMPQAARMRVLYYDRVAYEQLERPEPSLRWTWDEMAQDVAAFADGDVSSEYGFLDIGNDALFSYAYNWHNTCTELATVRCQQQLEPEAVAAALKWYADMVTATGESPDLTRSKIAIPQGPFDQDTRNVFLANWQSAQRRAVIWVEDPLLYELRFQLAPMGVLPFPGSDRFDGITPIWVQGHLILQESERPLATWEWIKFLSTQPLASRFRFVPARPSIANQSQYWTTLPRPLADAMRTAFPFARPVLIEEQATFSWEQLTAVLDDQKTPTQAATMRPDLIWFQQE